MVTVLLPFFLRRLVPYLVRSKDSACLPCGRLRSIAPTEPQSSTCDSITNHSGSDVWKRINSMKISNAARLIFWVAAIFALGMLVRAESGQKRESAQNTKSGLIRIVDQSGRPVVSGVPSGTGQIVDVTVAPGGSFTFDPATVNISVGDTVRWTWSGSGHSVTSGPHCIPDSQFCSPDDTNCFPGTLSTAGTVYEHTFTAPGSYSYICIAHYVIGMTGVVNVSGSCVQPNWSAGPDMPMTLVRAV